MFSGIVEECATLVALVKEQENVHQTATCINVEDAEGSYYFTFRYTFDKEMAKRGYITVDKGSVTVNGVSLTVCNPTDDTFQVAIIPYTFEHTNFHDIKAGSVVNLGRATVLMI